MIQHSTKVNFRLLAGWVLSLCVSFDNSQGQDEFRSTVRPFLNTFCVECHGRKKSEAEFQLHDIVGDEFLGEDIVRWEKILEMISLAHMPPRESPQPAGDKRKRVMKWIASELTKIGRGPDAGKLALPSQANRINHQELFSGEHKGPAFSPARRWRISPHAYQRFARDLRTQVSQPLQGLGGKGIQDYASLLADQSTIQTMLRNSNLIADRLMFTDRAPLNHLFRKGADPQEKDIDDAIRRLFQIVYQREPTDSDQLRLIKGLFEKNRKVAGLQTGMRSLIVGMLLSQEFVFRLEVGLGKQLADGRRMLSPNELAFALSFAFFDQPDRKLIQAAREGRLESREDVRREVLAILDRRDEGRKYWNYPMYHRWGEDYYQHHPRVLRFFQEFFGYVAVADVFKDRERNPDHHANRLRKDADFLVLWVLNSDKDVLKELLTTNRYPIEPLRENQIQNALSDKNNRFYRGLRDRIGDDSFEQILQAGFWPGMQSRHVSAYNLVTDRAEAIRRRPGEPIEFPKTERAGMLTHPAWLVAHSGNFDNDPIRRGKWIRERLLAGNIPDVPIGVDAKIPDDPHRTLRERLQVVHKSECWRCHKQMNPLGIVFESYDDFGQHRTRILIGDADGYRKAKRKYDNDRRRLIEELARWKNLNRNGRIEKVREAESHLSKLKKPDPKMENYTALLRHYENDLKRWTNERRKWTSMTDSDQQRQIDSLNTRLRDLVEPTPESRPVDAGGELRGTDEEGLDGPVKDAIDLVHRLAKSRKVRQSFVRHAFRFWMGRNETLADSPTLIDADRAYVESGGSFKALLASLLTSDSFLYRKEIDSSTE